MARYENKNKKPKEDGGGQKSWALNRRRRRVPLVIPSGGIASDPFVGLTSSRLGSKKQHKTLTNFPRHFLQLLSRADHREREKERILRRIGPFHQAVYARHFLSQLVKYSLWPPPNI
jgi:hypothetical protein